jgi:signal transduction histidine kinase
MWILVAGFSLVILLLVVAGVIAARNTHAIEEAAARLAADQTVAVRLIDEIQEEQLALGAVFYQLIRAPEDIDRESALKELSEAEEALDRVVASATGSPEEKLWRQLGRAAHQFAVEARRILDADDDTSLSMTGLLVRHEEVVGLVAKLVEAGSARATATERHIDRQAKDLVRDSFLLLGASVILAFVGAVFTVRFATQSFRKVEWQAEELSRVSWNMVKGQEEAARRFSHELHDELGQALAAVKANLMAVNPGNVDARRADCIHLVDEAIGNVRELSQLLRPVILDDFGLDAGLRWLADKFMQRTGVQVKYESNLDVRLADETETHLFRIAQEALTNVARHSGASEVGINLRAQGEDVVLLVSDNGRGLNGASDGSGSLGMIGMHARARNAGGEATVRTSATGGVEIDAKVPLRRVTADAEQETPHHVG